MKLLYFFAVIFSVNLNSQIIYQENFDTLNTGPIVGQGSYVNYLSAGGEDDFNYEIINSLNGKALSLKGFEAEISKGKLTPNRNPGNDFIQIEYDYYTGSPSDNTSKGGVMLIDDYYDSRIGLQMEIGSKRIFAAARYWGVPTGENPIGAGNNEVFLPADSWVRLGFACKIGTNACTFKGPGFYKTISWGSNPLYQDLYIVYWVTSAASNPAHIFDNVVVKAVANESILKTDETFQNLQIEIYPNPVEDYIYVKAKERILNVYIYDTSGVRKSSDIIGGKINMKDFPAGSYILGLKTSGGFYSKKVIKK